MTDKLVDMLKRIIVNEVIKALASHKTTIHEDSIKDIYLKKNDILRHIHSGNHVIQTTTGFFRFCPLHTERNNYNRNRLQYHLSTLPLDPSDMLFLESFFRSDVNLSAFIQFCSSRRFTDNNHTNFSHHANT